MLEKNRGENQTEDSAAFDSRFKYAVIAYAVIELFAIAFVVYYKAAR
jgi:hypothetical protein